MGVNIIFYPGEIQQVNERLKMKPNEPSFQNYHALYSTCIFFIILLTAGCSENITTECVCDPITPPAGEKTLASFSEIQRQVFNVSCALSGCHAGATVQAGLNLTEGNSYSALINKQSILNPGFKLVQPGSSENSFLIKVLTNNGIGASQMPPTGKLDNSIIDSISAWIDRGALNN